MKTPSIVCLPLLWLAAGCVAGHAAAITNATAQAGIDASLRREAVRLDAMFLDGISNRVQWEARRAELRQEYFEMLGLWPLPDRTPLQAKVTGVLERAEGFRVEKVHFQSRPGLYVTGNLYLPGDAASGAKLPAVLYVCGHSGRGRDGNKTAFQHHGMWFAMNGYACLIIDTLQLGEIAAIHHGTYRYNRWWWQARGYTPAGVECWNGIRALDYLLSRPEVDPTKVAVTGISGGGAATFWIAAADERVKVAVPVSGMSDLEDYVGEKVVNGHCDCMFFINTFQWPWTQIAALVAPRPMLFANSGHDTIFPMSGNERIRSRLERLYGFYTNRTERLFDIAVTPGGHEDHPELRLMAYRWINRFLKNDNSPVTEPDLPKFDGKELRVFPDEPPSDQLNTRIDELFVAGASNAIPGTRGEFRSWQRDRLAEIERVAFRGTRERAKAIGPLFGGQGNATAGTLTVESGVTIAWRFIRGAVRNSDRVWLVVLEETDSIESPPTWVRTVGGNDSILLVAPRGMGPTRWNDPAPYSIQRSLPLLGHTVDSGRVGDVLLVLDAAGKEQSLASAKWTLAGRGRSGVIAAYAALLDSRSPRVVVVDPPASHRNGPIFLNIMRVVDIPEALGLLAPRDLSVLTSQPQAFATTTALYGVGGGTARIAPLP